MCPNDWPELLGQLVGVINEPQNTPAVDGAVRCLATFVEDLDDVQLVQVGPCIQNYSLCDQPPTDRSKALHHVRMCKGCLTSARTMYPYGLVQDNPK